MTATITTSSKAYARLLQIIEKQPGISSRNLAAAAGYSLPHTKNALAVISRAKTASPVELGGRNRGWYVQAIAGDLLKAWASKKRRAKMESEARPPCVRDQIYSMCCTDEDGGSSAKIAAKFGITEKSADRHCSHMVKRGRLFSSVRGNCRMRWFGSQERADVWAEMPPVAVSEMKRKPGRPKQEKAKAAEFKAETFKREIKKAEKVAAKKAAKLTKAPVYVIKAKPANDAPVTLHGKPSDMRGAIDYSRAKITICPAPPSIYRHEYDPTSKAHQAFVRRIADIRGAA